MWSEFRMFKARVAPTMGLPLLTSVSVAGQAGFPAHSRPKPRVLVVAVNGAERDLLRPLLIRGQMPNLRRVVEKGVYGKLRTTSAPNCPKIFTAFLTAVAPEQNGITGFVVGGQTAKAWRARLLSRSSTASMATVDEVIDLDFVFGVGQPRELGRRRRSRIFP